MINLFILIVAAVWLVPTVVCWRMLAGHVAWRIHATAKQRRGIKPEIEDWIWGAISMVPLAPFWPLVLYFAKAPRLFKGEDEREAERLSAQIKLERLIQDNQRQAKALERGDPD